MLKKSQCTREATHTAKTSIVFLSYFYFSIKNGGTGWDRTTVGVARWFPTKMLLLELMHGGTGWDRTTDLGLMSPTL